MKRGYKKHINAMKMIIRSYRVKNSALNMLPPGKPV